MRTRRFVIGLFVLLTLAACNRPDTDLVETQRATSQIEQVPEPVVPEAHRRVEGPSPELSAIDSLMWHQPDSALACLIPYFDTCRDVACNVYPENHNGNSEDVARYVSTNVAFNRHYAHLLLSELLYKNDYAQTNRPALWQAVRYFDSLTFTLNDTPSPKRLIAGSSFREGGTLSLTRNDNLSFLTARAHYINGVGYYENDSLVPACAEYLKALEVMEEHFDEKDLVGKKARFMTYTYNRLGDMFSDQYMMESSIVCYEKALVYCIIEPTSPQGISNIYTRLGVQYDKLGNKDKMRDSYEQAIKSLPSGDNLGYRDLVVSKALGDYQLGLGLDNSLNAIRQILVQADDDDERSSRYLVIGAIFAEEKMYDSALFYLEPLFEVKENIAAKMPAAECLQIIYDSIGDNEKLDKCRLFLASKKKSEAQNKALVSQLDDLFKSFTNQTLKNDAEKAREKSIRKTILVIVPIAVIVALVILIMVKLKNKKLLEEQQEDADRKLEESEQQHRMEQAAISGRLKRSNQEVRELKDQIKQLDDLAAKTETASSFNEEPICRLIMERVHEGQFKSKIDCELYKTYALDKQQMLDLRMAADRHFSQFTLRLRKAYPKLTSIDIDYCCLYLLNLTYADVSALMQRAYNTVVERDGKIQKIIGSEKPLPVLLMDIAQNPSSV